MLNLMMLKGTLCFEGQDGGGHLFDVPAPAVGGGRCEMVEKLGTGNCKPSLLDRYLTLGGTGMKGSTVFFLNFFVGIDGALGFSDVGK
jgi:hypothetical protein